MSYQQCINLFNEKKHSRYVITSCHCRQPSLCPEQRTRYAYRRMQPSPCLGRKNHHASRRMQPSLCPGRRTRSVSLFQHKLPSLDLGQKTRNVSLCQHKLPSLCPGLKTRSVSCRRRQPSLCLGLRTQNASRRRRRQPNPYLEQKTPSAGPKLLLENFFSPKPLRNSRMSYFENAP
jgi:hypothetical protein